MLSLTGYLQHMFQQELVRTIESWLAGEEASFAPIFNYYRPKLFRYSLRYMHSAERAEEITSDALFKLWRSKKLIGDPSTFENYLFTIARNCLINEWRKKIDAMLSLDMIAEHPIANLADPMACKELEQTYLETLYDLPAQRRKIFIMHREQNLSYKEIARKLNLSPKTVENQIGSALKHLRARLAHLLFSFLY